jgi:ubiquinone biosynthesis monooxygenase Coq6
MMSAVDKLHKLYASTVPPVVWARSTGVEVLNELDTLKAGIIGAACGRSSAGIVPGSPWGMVASGVETLVSGTRVIGTGLNSVAGGILQQLARVASTWQGQKRMNKLFYLTVAKFVGKLLAT